MFLKTKHSLFIFEVAHNTMIRIIYCLNIITKEIKLLFEISKWWGNICYVFFKIYKA